MGLRFEAWSLPWSASFTRTVADIPVETGHGTIKFNDFGEGEITVPSDYSRLSEIISDTVGSLIRVYDGTVIVQEFLAERVEYRIEDQSLATISGGDLATVFDRAVVYPYDYPTNSFPDHIWGGENLLQNPGFEESAPRPEVNTIVVTATGGTFTLTDGTDTTSTIAYNAAASTIETRLEADITAIDDVNVVGTGTSDDPYVITFVAPAVFAGGLTINTGSLTGGSATLTRSQYGALQPSGWDKSQTISRGITQVFGEYDSFRVTTAQTHTGTYSLLVDPAEIGRRYAGAQQVVNVDPGGVYQASVWIYTGSSSQNYRFVIRGVDEDLLAAVNIAPSASTWTQATLTDVDVGDNSQIIFRIANIDGVGADPAIFYIDDAVFQPGAADATVGTIITSLMDDATSDHSADTRGTILDWVDYTGFDATNDSAAVAWDTSLSFTAYRGMTYGQVFDALREIGYEWTLTPKATPGATTHDLNWYNTDGAGTDYSTAATPSLLVGQGTTGGPILKRIPQYTAVLAEGANNLFVEDSDSTAVTNFGRFETYTGDLALASSASLNAATDAVLAKEAANRTAVSVEVTATASHPRPLVDYTVGDLVNFQFPPLITKTARRIRQVVWRQTDTTVYTVTGSRIFGGEAGGWESVRILLRKFNRLQKPSVTGPSINTSTGGTPSFFLAAADAGDMEKQKADLVCEGTDDTLFFQRALDAVPTTGPSGARGGELVLSSGSFNLVIGSSYAVTIPAGVAIRGLGANNVCTWIVLDTNNASSAGRIFDLNSSDSGQFRLQNVGFSGLGSSDNAGAIKIDLSTDVLIGNCYFGGFGGKVIDGPTYEQLHLRDCFFQGNYSNCLDFSGATRGTLVVDSYFVGPTSGTAAYVTSSSGGGLWLKDNRFVNGSGGINSILDAATPQAAGYYHIQNNDATLGGVGTANPAIYLHMSSTQQNAVNITGNRILNANGAGIHAGFLKNGVIANNIIETPQSYGIILQDTDMTNIIGNMIVDASAGTANVYDGIRVQGSSSSNFLQANTIRIETAGRTKYGVNVAAGTANTYVGNQVVGTPGSASYNDAGTSTVNTWPGAATPTGDNF